ncbi:MAG: patatin-like phospholipase family protein [Smithellaceae bacterium]
MSKFKTYFILSLFIAAVILSGCSHYPQNQPLESAQGTDTYDFNRINSQDNSDETFVVLTFSGGGTRAAALAYGVLDKLRTIHFGSTGKTLLDEVDVISTVSGGSFTGAYYTLFGNKIFAEFKDKFLYRDLEAELFWKMSNPVNWWRLASPYFSRIDLAAEIYNESIFNRQTYGALTQKVKKPFLIVNATNLYQGARFEFTSRQFRYLGSDIRSYPIARAVAASSAFPFLLSPISLVNYPNPSGKKITPQDALALEDYWNNKRRYYTAKNNNIYDDAKEHPYVHLMDGGLADNLGLRAVYDLYVREDIRAKINNGKIKRLLVIVVNAKTKGRETFDKNEAPPGLKTTAYKTATISMDNYTFESVEAFAGLLNERNKAQQNIADCQQLLNRHAKDGYKIPPLAGGNLKLYVVDLAFDNLADSKLRDYFNDLPTSLKLSKEQVNNLIDVGGKLLIEHPEFQKFISENIN